MNIMVTGVFWIALWDVMKALPGFRDSDLMLISMALNHSLPLFCSLIEYFFLNSIPFCFRHNLVLIPIMIIYLMGNLFSSLAIGEPVYHIMDWTTPMGAVVGSTLPFGFLLLFVIIKFLNQRKLRYLGHGDLADIIAKQKLKTQMAEMN